MPKGGSSSNPSSFPHDKPKVCFLCLGLVTHDVAVWISSCMFTVCFQSVWFSALLCLPSLCTAEFSSSTRDSINLSFSTPSSNKAFRKTKGKKPAYFCFYHHLLSNPFNPFKCNLSVCSVEQVALFLC